MVTNTHPWKNVLILPLVFIQNNFLNIVKKEVMLTSEGARSKN